MAALATKLEELVANSKVKAVILADESHKAELEKIPATDVAVAYIPAADAPNIIKNNKINLAYKNTLVLYKDVMVVNSYTDVTPASFDAIAAEARELAK